jgi:alkylation response protein AidB-like acyl-CoA dehydrogenase
MREVDRSSFAGVIKEVIEPQAERVGREAVFPRAAIDALGEIGLLGLLSAEDVGGLGQPLRAAARAVERIGAACASTGMVMVMHYVGASVVEKYGPRSVREEIAAGKHLATVALSEADSRSHFWAPVGTAKPDGQGVRLDAEKSWVTSAGHADSMVWSSKPLEAEGMSTLWLVPGKAGGLRTAGPFDGLGLRGNASSPVKADGVRLPREAMLGADGKGYDIMSIDMNPVFLALCSACYLGITEAAATKAAAHVSTTRFSYLGQSLADLPTIRAYLARIRIKTDMVRAFLDDEHSARESGREDALLRMLEIKAAAGEAAAEVTELAMRICGGAAFRKDVGVERHFRDARAVNVMAPTTDVLYDLVGKVASGLPLG